MVKRTLEVSTPGTHIRLDKKHLAFFAEERGDMCVPVEDLGVLMLDSPQISLTQAALTACAEAGAAVVFCGRDHHPAGLVLPVAGNVLHTQRLRAQVDAKKPVVKQIWRHIVRAKIRLQAHNLPLDDPARKKLLAFRDDVKSGDTTNREAHAARLYWPVLFGADFRRVREGPPPNNLLNYGYMALRATVARALVAAGLHPALGLHHRHRENPFALADDLMEPYRPFVDCRVWLLRKRGKSEIDREVKAALLSVLAEPVNMRAGSGPLMVAVQKSAHSVYECLAGEAAEPELPLP
ncbi:MAG: type II CRISPR-associated endonuclease Cas1 [Deltaproteobacteria bacterium]|nr:type II CRISPR-associated endonuclease Cas1 [Deltaproteobacteria bacterium]